MVAAVAAASGTPTPHATLTPLPPGPTALASRVADVVGSFVLALQLSSAAGAAGAAAARRAAADRGDGAELQAALAGATPGLLLAARAAAETARACVWLAGGMAAVAVLAPPDVASPAPLAALSCLGLATALACAGQGVAAAAVTPDRDAAAAWPGSASWVGTGALVVREGLKVAPLIWPARARAAARAGAIVGAAATALAPGYNLMSGVLAAVLPEVGDGGGVGPASPFAWSAAGRALAALAAQAAAFWGVAWAIASLPPGAGARTVRRAREWRWTGARPEGQPLLERGSDDDSDDDDSSPPTTTTTTLPAAITPAREATAVAAARAAWRAGDAAPWPLCAAGVTKTFTSARGRPPTLALAHVSLGVRPGECLAVVGANGAGKSTLFRLVVGELAPDRGSVRVSGVRAASPAARGLVSYCPQARGAPPELTPREAVAMAARLRGATRAAAGADADALLAAVGLGGSPAADAPLSSASGGQARRAAVAAALTGTPVLVVLDEPTAGLDASARARVWAAVSDRATSRGAGVLVSSHRASDVDAVAARVAVLAGGRVAAVGAPSALRAAAGRWLTITVAPRPGASVDGAADAAATALGPDATRVPAAEVEAKFRVTVGSGNGDDDGDNVASSALVLAAAYDALATAAAADGGTVGRYAVARASLDDAFAAVARVE